MILCLLFIHNHDRMSSVTRVLHATTWGYFTTELPAHFNRSQKVVKEAIMRDINDLVHEFWRTSSDGVVGASFFAMRRLHIILEQCEVVEKCWEVCLYYFRFCDCRLI